MNNFALLRNIRSFQDIVDDLSMSSGAEMAPPETQQLDLLSRYRAMISSDELRACTETLFVDGHYKQAVEAAFVCLENNVRDRSSVDESGVKLMNQVFSKDKPRLKLNKLRSQSEKDEQDGYRYLFSGGMAGIRNPRAHNHDLRDEPDAALEMLVLANHLMRALGRCTKARRSKLTSRS